MNDTVSPAGGAPQGAATSSGMVGRPCSFCVGRNIARVREGGVPADWICRVRFDTIDTSLRRERPAQPPAVHLLKCLPLSPDVMENGGTRSIPSSSHAVRACMIVFEVSKTLLAVDAFSLTSQPQRYEIPRALAHLLCVCIEWRPRRYVLFRFQPSHLSRQNPTRPCRNSDSTGTAVANNFRQSSVFHLLGLPGSPQTLLSLAQAGTETARGRCRTRPPPSHFRLPPPFRWPRWAPRHARPPPARLPPAPPGGSATGAAAMRPRPRTVSSARPGVVTPRETAAAGSAAAAGAAPAAPATVTAAAASYSRLAPASPPHATVAVAVAVAVAAVAALVLPSLGERDKVPRVTLQLAPRFSPVSARFHLPAACCLPPVCRRSRSEV